MIDYRHTVCSDREALTALWQEAFGDEREFVDCFFASAYAPERSLGAFRDGCLAGALYWFDCVLQGEKIAYVYAVATAKASRGQGIATNLMEQLHGVLRGKGYGAAVLCPGSEELFRFYSRMGYRTAGTRRERKWKAGEKVDITQISREEYALRRAVLLPPGGIRQEGESLLFLEQWCRFYGGAGFCAAVSRQDGYCPEFLGEEEWIPGMLASLGMEQAVVRTPGGEQPCLMALRFSGNVPQRMYLGFAFD